MPFDTATNRLVQKLPTQTKPTGGGVTRLELPKTGFLAGLMLRISATVTGSLSNENAYGASSIVNRVRLITNSAVDLINMSGVGYAYLFDEMQGLGVHRATGQNQGRTAVSAATFNLDMYLPIALNLRDPIGLFMLGNEQTVVTLEIDWLADASVATGATVAATAVPYMEFFTVPQRREDYPPLNVLHTITEDQESVAATGEYTKAMPRGNTYVAVAHGLGIGASGSDSFDTFQRRVNQSTYIYNGDDDSLDIEHRMLRGRARPGGVVVVDFAATAGLGKFGSTRDLINTAQITNLDHIFNATATGTLFTVREELVPIIG